MDATLIPTRLISRCCIALVFILSGVHIMLHAEKLVPEVTANIETAMISVGFSKAHFNLLVRDHVAQLLYLACSLQLIGGVVFVFGHESLGSLLLLVFTVPVTFIQHAFWELPEGAKRRHEVIQFLKNVSIIGCLLYVFTTQRSRKYKME